MPPEILTLRTDKEFTEAMAERERRKEEAIYLYRAMPSQLPFHLSKASEKVVRGGNRSGKTTCMMCEIASAVMGVPLHGPDGEELPFLYPKDRPLLVWLIGYDARHIGRMWHKLFAPGLFKLVRDEETGELRPWRPWEPEDAVRESELVPAPPLIPPRMIKEWAWENKAERAFTVCRLHNGTEIYAFSSGSEAATGDPVDIIGIDEAIKYPKHVAEWQARLSDNRGKLLWSSWPRMSNSALKDMCDRAAAQSDWKFPDVIEICLRFSDNPYQPADEKRKRLAGWSDVERRARDLGEFVTDLTLVFPSFHSDVQGLPSKMPRDLLEDFLAKRNWQVPLDWTNYLTIDPGHAHLAVLFASIPPPELGDHIVIWGELCTPHLDADQVAIEVNRLAPNRMWEAFYMDKRGGRRTTEGLGKDIRTIYTEGFQRQGLESKLSGNSFIFGCDDISARNMLVRTCLRPQERQGPKLRFISGAIPSTLKEFGLYNKRVTRDDIKDEVDDKNNHSMDALGYLVAANPIYVVPVQGTGMSPRLKAYLAFEKRYAPKQTESVYMGPGAAPKPEMAM